jgi:hypothetical protein
LGSGEGVGFIVLDAGVAEQDICGLDIVVQEPVVGGWRGPVGFAAEIATAPQKGVWGQTAGERAQGEGEGEQEMPQESTGSIWLQAL